MNYTRRMEHEELKKRFEVLKNYYNAVYTQLEIAKTSEYYQKQKIKNLKKLYTKLNKKHEKTMQILKEIQFIKGETK